MFQAKPRAGPVTARQNQPTAVQSLVPCSITGNTVTLIAVGTCTLQASQAGSATWLAAIPVTNSFAITISSGGGSGEVPLPLWSLLLLGAGLFGALSRQRRAGG